MMKEHPWVIAVIVLLFGIILADAERSYLEYQRIVHHQEKKS